MNIVFDFGAVLFTWQPAKLIATTFPEIADTDEAAHALARAIFSHDDWHAFDRGVLDLADVVLRTTSRLALPHARLRSLVEGIGEQLTPMTDTVAVLERLVERRVREPDLRLYFLSNMPAPYARLLERQHAFLNSFDGGIFSGDVQRIKPEPEIFALLENRYSLQPDQTVFIDDLKSNVAAAQSRGWHGIHFESAPALEQQLESLRGYRAAGAAS